MDKQSVTLELDEDVVAALAAASGGRSMSDVANVVLREALESRAHRAALLAWLRDLYAQHGPPSAEEYAAADELLDTLQGARRVVVEQGAA